MKKTVPTKQLHNNQVRKNNNNLTFSRIMNLINSWRRKLDKVKKQKIYRYGKNVQSTLNLTVKEQYSINETFEDPGGSSVTTELVLDDNVAIENQVKLVAFKDVGSQKSSRHEHVSCDSKRSSRLSSFFNDKKEKKYDRKNDSKRTSLKKHNKTNNNDNSRKYRDRDRAENDELKKQLLAKKPLKRLISHSEQYEHIYKKINWQDWTISEPSKHYNTFDYKKPTVDYNKPSILIEEVTFDDNKSPTSLSDVFRPTTAHSELTFDRLSRMYLDYDDVTDDDVSSQDADRYHHSNNENNNNNNNNNKNNNDNRYFALKVPVYSSSVSTTESSTLSPFVFPDSYRTSLKSFDDSHRGSVQSRASITSYYSGGGHRRSSPVPMNFIPGQTKPITRKERYASVPFNDIQTATFCFKGITCQLERSKPRTSKAIVHMGMMIISITGPTAHHCAH